eukprot:TRINITY_DN5369_c0_g1_i5.p1 TRINITY_DN5369_c0_g1~~TRINITY_DN5369_c0_g1_i5.p1  ORF type:complete len:534 (-),score=115.31 TRINITY_DN5369_c0_g1_i5:331-1932(-)
MHEKLEACLKDWSDLAEEYQDLERKHKEYRQFLDKSISWQKKCLSGVTHQKYRLNVIKKLMKEIEPTCKEEEGELEDLRKDILRRQGQLSQMMETLPTKSGRYLRVIMGNVDVSILDKNEKYRYKEQYESFKLIVNLIGGILATTNFFLDYRILDLVFFFLIVWYYCTLTIRESILIVNGSRIKGWWRAHHFVSCVVGGVLLVWPDGPTYRDFRDQNMLLNIYVAFLQYLQYVYQKGCLYRLRSLGERQDMDITIDGFHSWMWKGLGFLLPFLYIGYLMQLYNSYTLYLLCSHPEVTWQVPVLCGLFLLLGAGNLVTTSMTIPKKWMESKTSSLKYKFVRLDKYFWSHRRRRTTISQANPEFSEHVDRILRRGSSDTRIQTPDYIQRAGSDVRKDTIQKVEEEVFSYTSDEPEMNQVEVNERPGSKADTRKINDDIHEEKCANNDHNDDIQSEEDGNNDDIGKAQRGEDDIQTDADESSSLSEGEGEVIGSSTELIQSQETNREGCEKRICHDSESPVKEDDHLSDQEEKKEK